MGWKFSSRALIGSYLVFTFFYYAILGLEIEPFVSYSDVMGLIGNLLAFPLFWHGIRNCPEERSLPWKIFAACALANFLGDVVWAYHTDLLGIEPDMPSVCDAFYLCGTSLLFVGIISYFRQTRAVNMVTISFDIIISVFASGGLIYNFIIRPILQEKSGDMLPMLTLLFYPVCDFAITAGLLVMLFGTDIRWFLTKTNVLMSIAFAMMFMMDQIFLLETIRDTSFGIAFEPLWTVGYFLLGLACVCSEREPVTRTRLNALLARRNGPVEYFRILMPYLFAISILLLVGMEHNLLASFFLWAVLLVLLLSARQVFVLVRNNRLMHVIRQKEKMLNLQNLELQKLNRQILHDAEIDFLTQLSNRRYIDQIFEKLMPVEGKVETLGLMIIDVDFFKRINDTYGHQRGDEVLQDVALEIREVIRSQDIAGRFGGDEFIVLLPGADRKAVASVAGRLQDRIRENALLASMNVTLSIGCASWCVTRTDYNVERLLKRADDALYRAKEQGRNRFLVAEE